VPIEGRTQRIYSIRNHGSTTLTLTIAGGGCGCTRVKLGGAVIEPSEVVTMSVTYRPEQDPKARGRTEVVKQVTIWSDDPVRPVYKLGVHVMFEPPGPQ
jgi:hypothetical protein